MSIKSPKSPVPGPALAEPVREALQTLEQALAAGWYPARQYLMTRLAEASRPGLPVWVPEADVELTPTEVLVCVDLPGMEKADIRVEVEDDALTVSGRRRGAEDGRGRREQLRGSFLRRLPLPAPVRPAGARASHRNGVLRVTLPRAKGAYGRSVKVE